MITVKDFRAYRDKKIYQAFKKGNSQKRIGAEAGLSESRVKQICAAQRNILAGKGKK